MQYTRGKSGWENFDIDYWYNSQLREGEVAAVVPQQTFQIVQLSLNLLLFVELVSFLAKIPWL